jgi:hypothetical protein
MAPITGAVVKLSGTGEETTTTQVLMLAAFANSRHRSADFGTGGPPCAA